MQRRTKFIIPAALLAAAICLFAALRFLPPRHVTLRFDVGGEQTALELEPGSSADVSGLETAPEGQRFICWLGPDGNPADPELPAERSASYTALLAPLPSQDPRPWLEYDELGRLRPDELISGAELARGVSALFDGAFEPEGLDELHIVSQRDLAFSLRSVVPAEELEPLDSTEPMTRLEAASAIAALAGLEPGRPETAPAPDLAADREGAAALAACADPAGAVSYKPGPVIADGGVYYVDESGLFVTNAEIGGLRFGADGCCRGLRLTPGFVNIAGYLYYVEADGSLAADTDIGGLHFAADGRYTSGSEELDGLVAGILSGICAENESREGRLYAAYVYVRDGFQYLRRNFYTLGETGWELEEALTMLTTGRGNCYNYAAAFWALARGLGYDAEAVSGTLGWDYDRHGWVVIYDEAGTRLTYDPETEMAYIRDGDRPRNMFAMSPAYAAGWNYHYGA